MKLGAENGCVWGGDLGFEKGFGSPLLSLIDDLKSFLRPSFRGRVQHTGAISHAARAMCAPPARPRARLDYSEFGRHGLSARHADSALCGRGWGSG